jgi:DNA polymerase III epsilon subunit-like protein
MKLQETKQIINNWKTFINETMTVKHGSFYPKEFSQFLELLQSHKDDIWIVFDTETTGLMYKEDYVQPTQIACLAFDTKGFAEGTQPEPIPDGVFDVKVKLQDASLARKKAEKENPELSNYPIAKIFSMTRYGEKKGNYVTPEQAINSFEKYIDKMESAARSGKVLFIAQNSPFDIGILNACYKRIGRQPPNIETWDTKAATHYYLHPIAKALKDNPEATEEDIRIVTSLLMKNGGLSSSLGQLIKAFDIQNKGWHNAMADVQMTMDILYNIVNYVKKASKRTKVDFSSTKQFDATAGDPYSTIHKK